MSQKETILNLFEMQLHKIVSIYSSELYTTQCMRVPGGLIYEYYRYTSSEETDILEAVVYVPFPATFTPDDY